jgi:hypothetical protein
MDIWARARVFVKERDRRFFAPALFMKFTCKFGELLELTGICDQQKEFVVGIIYRDVYKTTSERKKLMLLVGFIRSLS